MYHIRKLIRHNDVSKALPNPLLQIPRNLFVRQDPVNTG